MMNVRELAAVDMYGGKGTTRRRRIILAEFVAGVVVMIPVGVVLVVTANSTISRLVGIYFIGVGLNYVPLAIHAISLSRRGALDAALRDVDLPKALRHYTVAQVWVFVPLALVVMDVVGRRR